MQPKAFLYRVILYTLIPVLGLVALNGFCLYHRINLHPSYLQALAIEEQHPKALILGSSRVRHIKPDSIYWPKGLRPVCSVCGDMQTVRRMQAHSLHALEFTALQEIVLCVDFFTFNTYNRGPPDPVEDFFLTQPLPAKGSRIRLAALYAFKAQRVLKQLFSLSYLSANSLSLYKALKRLVVKAGQPSIQPMPNSALLGLSDKLYLLESHTLNETFFISPSKCFTFDPVEGLRSHFDTLNTLLEYLYSRPNLTVKLVINPFHARFFELIHAAGLWPWYKEWLERLVHLNESQALKHQTTPYPLYDFSGYSAYNTEDFSTPQATIGRWYIESSHFNSDLGDLVLQRLYTPDSQATQDTFGKRIHSHNLYSHIQELEEGWQAYYKSHPLAIATIQGLYDQWQEANRILKTRKAYEHQSSYKNQ